MDIEAAIQQLQADVESLKTSEGGGSTLAASTAATVAEFEGRIQAVEGFVAATRAALKALGSGEGPVG